MVLTLAVAGGAFAFFFDLPFFFGFSPSAFLLLPAIRLPPSIIALCAHRHMTVTHFCFNNATASARSSGAG
jgi:hypothetical protein